MVNLVNVSYQIFNLHVVCSSIIEKEGSEGQQELKLKSVKYHVQPEEQLIPSDGAPGSRTECCYLLE